MKINSIKFYDYRAFYNGKDDQYLINIEGKNVLIYGENGSGKTSFYRGLKDFVTGADFVSHNRPVALNDGFIEIAFDDGTSDRIDDTGEKATIPAVVEAAKLNSFISYKELLKTYLVETGDLNLFDLLVNGILRNHELETLGPLENVWELQKIQNPRGLQEKFNEFVANGDLTAEEAKEQLEIAQQALKDALTKFSDELTLLITEINKQLKTTLDHFLQDLEVELRLDAIDAEHYGNARISADVKYFGQTISDYQEFLNEARLSAIAISIYFAAIKLNPTQNALKVLFLDDVFIGLDMSNRLPLLEIVKTEFADWQTFITTYDRHWFEIAKSCLNEQWLKIEMYAIKKKEHTFERPFIIKASNDYVKRAEDYRDLGDYPAASNYLRKEIERLLKERLPEEKTRDYGEKPHTLQYLWEILLARYSALSIVVDDSIKYTFDTIKLTLLNPLSHDNLSIPVYKHELLKAFKLVEDISKLPIIKKITLLSKGSEVHFKHPTENYTFKILLLSDWRMDVSGSSKTMVSPKCKVLHFQYNNQNFWNFKTNATLAPEKIREISLREDSLDKICDNLTKIGGLGITKDLFERNTTYNNVWTMKEIIQRSNDQTRPSLFTRLYREIFN